MCSCIKTAFVSYSTDHDTQTETPVYSFKKANTELQDECQNIYMKIRTEVNNINQAYSNDNRRELTENREDEECYKNIVDEAYARLCEIYSYEIPNIMINIITVSTTNPLWSRSYYTQRYVEAKRRLYMAIKELYEYKIEEFTWEMEGCYLALRVMAGDV
jgi:hypothetical protein